MRGRITYVIALLVVIVCLFAHVSELFDTWDNTQQAGNDTEFTLAVVALCVGASVVFVRLLSRLFLDIAFGIHPFLSSPQFEARPFCRQDVSSILISPSPPPLRV